MQSKWKLTTLHHGAKAVKQRHQSPHKYAAIP